MNNFSQTKMWSGLAGLFVVLALIVVFAISAFVPPQDQDNKALISEQRTTIEDIVREYLLQNPDVVRDSLLELERRDQLAEAQSQQQAIFQNSDLIFNSETDFVAGNPNGDVTMVEFFDYNCGFCRRALADLHRLLEEDPNLRVVLKEFPVLSEGSVEAARVSMAAISQEKFLEFHDAIFALRGAVNGARALEAAGSLGLDIELLSIEANRPAVNAALSTTLQVATALGINGTPSYVIGNRLIVGAVGYETLKAAIEAERERMNAGS